MQIEAQIVPIVGANYAPSPQKNRMTYMLLTYIRILLDNNLQRFMETLKWRCHKYSGFYESYIIITCAIRYLSKFCVIVHALRYYSNFAFLTH
jgi:hypothetical protein